MPKFGFFFGTNGNPGPVVYELIDGLVPNPDAWTQASWFIDPANSTGKASDDNDGKTALTPVLTYGIGIVANKWGTESPVLRQNTTLTWLSSQPVGGGDPVIFSPVMSGAVAQLVGTLVGVHAGAFGAVTAKNRATAQLLDVDLGFAALPGDLVLNTTAGKASVATVYKNVAGTVFALTQPQTPAPPTPIDSTTPMAEVDTWALGDTYRLFRQPSVNLVAVSFTPAKFIAPSFPNQVQLLHLRAAAADGIPGDDNVILGSDLTVAECLFDTIVCVEEATTDSNGLYYGAFMAQGCINTVGTSLDVMNGGAVLSSFSTSFLPFTLGNDVIIDATAGGANSILLSSIGGTYIFLQAVYFDGTVGIAGNANAASASTALWGPGTLDVVGVTRLIYSAGAGAAVATFLNTGGLLLNGRTQAYAITPTDPSAWHPRAAGSLTAANLDAAFPAPGSYQGLAYNIGGAAITNQATP